MRFFRMEAILPGTFAKRLRARAPQTDDLGIVGRYFPRDVRARPDMVTSDLRERCARCSGAFGAEPGILHVWRLRSGVKAVQALLTICDACDAMLRPAAYRHLGPPRFS